MNKNSCASIVRVVMTLIIVSDGTEEEFLRNVAHYASDKIISPSMRFVRRLYYIMLKYDAIAYV